MNSARRERDPHENESGGTPSLSITGRGWLELGEHWHAERCEFDADSGKLYLRLACEDGGTFSCGNCGAEGCKVHDRGREREWRHLDFLQHRTICVAPTLRVSCPSCGVRQAEIPWARPRSGFTVPFEFRVAELAGKMTMKEVAEIVEEPAARLLRVAKHYSSPAADDAGGGTGAGA